MNVDDPQRLVNKGAEDPIALQSRSASATAALDQQFPLRGPKRRSTRGVSP